MAFTPVPAHRPVMVGFRVADNPGVNDEMRVSREQSANPEALLPVSASSDKYAETNRSNFPGFS